MLAKTIITNHHTTPCMIFFPHLKHRLDRNRFGASQYGHCRVLMPASFRTPEIQTLLDCQRLDVLSFSSGFPLYCGWGEGDVLKKVKQFALVISPGDHTPVPPDPVTCPCLLYRGRPSLCLTLLPFEGSYATKKQSCEAQESKEESVASLPCCKTWDKIIHFVHNRQHCLKRYP